MKNAIKLIAVMATVVLCVFAVIKGAIFLLPFALAFLFAQIMEPAIRFLMRVCHMRRSWAAGLSAFAFFGLLALLLGMGIFRIITEIVELANDLPTIIVQITGLFEQAAAFVQGKLDLLSGEALSTIGKLMENIFSTVLGAAKTLTTRVVSGVFSLPKAIIFTVIMVFSTVFIMRDRDKMFQFARRQVPEKWVTGVLTIRDNLFSALFGYIRAQLLLMLVTFCELLIGFSILKVEYALLFAVIIAIVDALPIFGAGLFLIPGALFFLISQEWMLGIGLAVLYVLLIVVRQTLEPRIVGHEIGLHPLVTLVSMYAGMRMMGVFGMLAGPVLMLILKCILGSIMKGRTIKEILAAPRLFDEDIFVDSQPKSDQTEPARAQSEANEPPKEPDTPTKEQPPAQP